MPGLNDFNISPVQGQVDLQVPGTVVEAQAESTVVTAFIPGQALKQSTTQGQGLPKMVAITANTDKIAGFVCYSTIYASFAAGKIFDFAMDNTVMHMVAGAAILPGASVEYDLATNRVITAAGTNTKVGTLYGQKGATAAGDLVRVRIISPIA